MDSTTIMIGMMQEAFSRMTQSNDQRELLRAAVDLQKANPALSETECVDKVFAMWKHIQKYCTCGELLANHTHEIETHGTVQ